MKLLPYVKRTLIRDADKGGPSASASASAASEGRSEKRVTFIDRKITPTES